MTERGGQQRGRAFTVQPDTLTRDARAFELRARRWSFQKIADELGYADSGHAHQGVQRAIARANRDSLQESKAMILEHLDQLAQAAWRVLEASHIVVQMGKVIRVPGPDGELVPLQDDAPVLNAIDRLLAIERERIKVLGHYAPKQVQVFTHDSVDAAIAELEREIAHRAAAAGDGGRGPATEAVLPARAANPQD